MGLTVQDVRVDPVLSNVALQYQNDAYIADQILPVKTVSDSTGIYYKYDKSKFRDEDSERAQGSPANEVDSVGLSTTSYATTDHAFKNAIPEKVQDQADDPLDPVQDEVEGLREKLLIAKEKSLASYMANTSNLSQNTTLSGTDQWSDYENSDPIGDVRDAKESVHSSIFKKPNTLVLGKQTFNQLKEHPDIIDRIKYSQMGVATEELMARVFDVDQVLVGGSGENTATEGQSDSMSYIWGKHAWLTYIAPTQRLKQITFGWTITYQQARVKRWFDDDREATMVRVNEDYTQEIAASEAAYFIKNAVA